MSGSELESRIVASMEPELSPEMKPKLNVGYVVFFLL
jgi:hypothetical protein